MQRLIDAALSRSSALLLLLAMLLWSGIHAYNAIPKEMDPEIAIPMIFIDVPYPGIAPEDAEKLLVRPLETALRSIVGIKKIHGYGNADSGSVMLEFDAGFKSDKALSDVREKVNETKAKWPKGTKEPVITEINTSLFPVINVIMHGTLPERELLRVARELRLRLQAIPTVLKAEMMGARAELVEILIDPRVLVTYGLNTQAIMGLLREGNSMVAAGQMQRPDGVFSIKLRSLLEHQVDFLRFPIKSENGKIITLEDIAEVRYTFKDPDSIARVNGKPAIVLEVSKRAGSNIIATIDAVKAVIKETEAHFPPGLMVTYSQDQSKTIREMLGDLENNILFAVILAMMPIVLTMGARSAFLVALAIPGSFLFAMTILQWSGLTLNIVVLFSLILCVGMLVDAAIVVCEYADRKIVSGMSSKEAYAFAAKRMCWPVIAGVATHIIVFVPLLFWPGVMGKFMLYMPITVIITMTGSLLMAFFFLPAIGSYLGTPKISGQATNLQASELGGDIQNLQGIAGMYARTLEQVLQAPGKWVMSITGAIIGIIFLYALLGPGKEFFPYVEPDAAVVTVRAKGNLSIWQRDQLLKEIEHPILGMSKEIRVIYAKSLTKPRGSGGQTAAPDQIAEIQLEFQDWRVKRNARVILEEIRQKLSSIYGVTIEVAEAQNGPGQGKPIQLELRGPSHVLAKNATPLLQFISELPEVVDISDNLAVPEIEWTLTLDRVLAANYGITPEQISQHLQLFTNGFVVTTIRPETSDEEVDVAIRFPAEKRNITELMQLQMATPKGNVPLSHMVHYHPTPKQGVISRLGGERVITIGANVKPGALVDKQIMTIRSWLKEHPLDPSVKLHFAGESEDQEESAGFLVDAFIWALFAMALMMVIQFNSIYKMLIILSAVFLSTGGVLLALLVTYQPFGIVMGGIGIIALAGTIVNNNIIFIDTYDELRSSGASIKEILVRTGAQRLRPILLTAGTGVLGLLPMVFGITIDFFHQDVTIGAPSSQWWRQLSTTIAGGLAFATVLTLFYTPCLLLLGERFQRYWKNRAM